MKIAQEKNIQTLPVNQRKISLLYLGLIDGDLCCKEVAALGDKKFARDKSSDFTNIELSVFLKVGSY